MHPKSLERRIIWPLTSTPVEGAHGKRRGHSQVRFEISNIFHGMSKLNWDNPGWEGFRYARFRTNILFAVTDDSSGLYGFMSACADEKPELRTACDKILAIQQRIIVARQQNLQLYDDAGGRMLRRKQSSLRRTINHGVQTPEQREHNKNELERTTAALRALVDGDSRFTTDEQIEKMRREGGAAEEMLHAAGAKYFTKHLKFSQAPEGQIATRILVNNMLLFELEANDEEMDMSGFMPVVGGVRTFHRSFPLTTLQRALNRRGTDNPWYFSGDLFVFSPRADPSNPFSAENVTTLLVGNRNPQKGWALVLTREVLFDILMDDDGLRASDDGVLGNLFAFLCDWSPHPSHNRIPESGAPSTGSVVDNGSETNNGSGDGEDADTEDEVSDPDADGGAADEGS